MAEFTHSLNVALDDATYEKLTKVAEVEDRTITAQARRVLRQWAQRSELPEEVAERIQDQIDSGDRHERPA
jgi:predicted transcriptional regulator